MEVPEHVLRCARQLRGKQTDAENLLWHLLRSRSLYGYKFRRQHPVGRYIIDFYCHEAKLAIELDGGGHSVDEQAAYDVERTAALEGEGIAVLRFWNHDVLKSIGDVLEAILDALDNRSPSPGAPRHPLPEGEG